MGSYSVNRWEVFELVFNGPSEGNPFTEHEISGCFKGAHETKVCRGFYDGNGRYIVRFMPLLRANIPTVSRLISA